jgi:hypothetical protein
VTVSRPMLADPLRAVHVKVMFVGFISVVAQVGAAGATGNVSVNTDIVLE